MSFSILIVDDEPDVAEMFRQRANCLDDRNHRLAVLRLNSGITSRASEKSKVFRGIRERVVPSSIAPIPRRNFAL
jgi:hypothetical protein